MKLLLSLSILLLNTFLAYSGPIQDGVYYIINRAFLQVIQVDDWSYSDGAAVDFDSISGGDNQKFQLTSIGDFYKITALHSGKALTVPSFFTTGDTTQITQWTDSGESLQQWNIFAEDNSGFYTIQNRYSGQVMTTTQQYNWQPIAWADNAAATAAVDEPVAPAPDATDAIGQSDQAAVNAKIVAWPGYSIQNKLIQSTITAGNTYQDFLFVQVAGYGTVAVPLSEPVAAAGSAVDSSFADDVGVDMGASASAPAPVAAASAAAAPVMDATDDPINDPLPQAVPDAADEPVTSDFAVDLAGSSPDVAVGQGEVASSAQDTAQTASGGFLAPDTPVVEEPVEPAVQDDVSTADAALGGQS